MYSVQAATQLLSASRDGNVTIVKRVLNNAGVDVNVTDEVSVPLCVEIKVSTDRVEFQVTGVETWL